MESKENVLFLVQLPPPVHGAALMNETLVNSKVITNRFNVKVLPLRFAKRISDISRFSLLKLLKVLVVAFELMWYVVSFKPRVVYFTISPVGIALYRDCIYVAILKMLNVKRIFHLHTKGVRTVVERSCWRRVLYKWIFRGADVVLLSPLLFDDIEDVYDCGKSVFYVSNGIRVVLGDEEFTLLMKRKMSHVEGVRVLFLSHMMVTKGPLLVLEAAKILMSEGLSFRISFVGDWYDDECKNKFFDLVDEYGLGDIVEFLGPKYGEEKFEILKSSGILVFPTYREVFSVVLLEAMQFGLPVISTFEGAIPEIVENNVTGFLVPKGDVVSLAERMALLIKDANLRVKMGLAGRKRFMERYTSDRFEQNMLGVLEVVCG